MLLKSELRNTRMYMANDKIFTMGHISFNKKFTFAMFFA